MRCLYYDSEGVEPATQQANIVQEERERGRDICIYCLYKIWGTYLHGYILTLPVPGESPMFDRFFGWCGAVALCSRVVSRSAVVMEL